MTDSGNLHGFCRLRPGGHPPDTHPAVGLGNRRLVSRRPSGALDQRFIRKNHIRISDYLGAPYPSFNAFFQGHRPEETMDMARNMVSPCDGKLTICRIEYRFFIKGVSYTMESLLRDKALAAQYRGGYLFLSV